MHAAISKSMLLTAVLGLCAAGPALAWPAAAAPRQQTVRFSDLNLATPAGTLAVYRRIQSAAKSVCEARNPRDLSEAIRARACIKKAIQEAVVAVNDSGLTQTYLAARGLQNALIARASH